MSVAFYNLAGQVTGVIGPDPDGAGAALFPATKYTYRADGQVDYVESGTVTAQSSSWSGWSRTGIQGYSYDSYGRLMRQALYDGSWNAYQVVDTVYDSMSRVQCSMVRMDSAYWGTQPTTCAPVQTTSANGPDRVTYIHYDALGRVWKVTTGYGTSVAADEQISTFSNNGRLATLTDAEGNRTTYEYDGHDRLVKTRFPSPTTDGVSSTTDFEQVGYDANGNVTSFRTRTGETLGLTYDNLNRLTLKDVPTRSGLATTHTRDVYFHYDLFGNMTHALFDSASGEGLAFYYDALGRMTGTTQNLDGVSRWLGYHYDVAGNLTQLTHPDGNYFNYYRNGSGSLYLAYLNAASPLLYPSRYATGQVGAFYRWNTSTGSWFSGSATGYSYDGVGRLSSFWHDVAGTTYDTTTSFTYNPASQIASRTNGNDAYAFTAHFNVNRGYTANGLNQYTAAGSVSFGYDTNGNLTSDGTNTYVYDVENRLVTRSGGASATLRYDPLGRLYEVTGASGTRRFLYDGSDLVAEYNTSGTLLRRYVHGLGAGDDPQVWFEGSGVSDAARRYLYADERGSIVAVTDSAGNVTNVNTYDEYGIPGSSNAGAFQYTGQVWVPELGMYHYKARMYSPTLGRFMQTDPIGYGDGMNMYAYVGGDPVNGVDPTGWKAILCQTGEICVTGPAPDGCTGGGICLSGDAAGAFLDMLENLVNAGILESEAAYEGVVTVVEGPKDPAKPQTRQAPPQNDQVCPPGYDVADFAADASNASLALEGSAAVLGVGAIAASPTGVGGGALGLGAAGAAIGSKVAAVVSIGAYGYDYLNTGRTSSLVGAGTGALSLLTSGIATRVTSNVMRSGRMFGNLSAPQRARLDVASAAYGSAAGAAEKLLLGSGC